MKLATNLNRQKLETLTIVFVMIFGMMVRTMYGYVVMAP